MQQSELAADAPVAACKRNPAFVVLNRASDVIAAMSTASMFMIVIVQIVGRLANQPAPWTEEATRFIFIWMVFLGVAIGFRRAESARVTYFLKLMPRIIQRVGTAVYMLASTGFFIFMFYTGLDIVTQQLNTNEMGSALMIPMWIVGISVPVSSLLAIIGIIESAVYHRELV
ncbi:TRAP transporter small permease [uncultured Paenibacillus sp.]|uniref:TRAP transporter small permease n=1 Tax=uncultured Paenibacillus sp. TaxID=227322 RepID=UPI0028D8D276|nr:TRAP transporter small permease [uncultured Paenibacillus sp.]